MSKTLRLILPVWQGGVNPNYAFGAELLAFIAPPAENEEVFLIETDQNFNKKLEEKNGIIEEEAQLEQLELCLEVLNKKNPDKVIVFGGDCSVSQGPFDYLSGKYGKKLGVIWLDAHPDISIIEESNHNHELVLANIMGKGKSTFAKKMQNPVPANKVIYAGLVEDSNRKMQLLEEGLNISIISPEEIQNNSKCIFNWIEENNINNICVHFDLDVLSPKDFRSLTSAKPYQTTEEYGAAIGKLTLNEVVNFLNKVNEKAEIVGLTIAEHVPWDAINLRNALSKLPIFKS